MKTLKVDHIGIAVKDLKDAVKTYEKLGLCLMGEEVIESQKVKVGFLPCGESELELLEATSPESPVAKFIEKKGEGLHHIALRVSNIDSAIKQLNDDGVRMIDEVPRYGAGNGKIAFLHPKDTNGVLIELVER